MEGLHPERPVLPSPAEEVVGMQPHRLSARAPNLGRKLLCSALGPENESKFRAVFQHMGKDFLPKCEGWCWVPFHTARREY